MAWSDAARAAAAATRKAKASQKAYGMNKMTPSMSKGLAGALVGAAPKGFFSRNDRISQHIQKAAKKAGGIKGPEHYVQLLRAAKSKVK